MHSMKIYKKGVEAYKAAKYVKALSLWKTLAIKGNPAIQYTLGQMYDKGEGVAQNFHQAAKWYLAAAINGHVEAQYSIAMMLDAGEGIEKNSVEAAKWYLCAANNGHTEAEKCILRSRMLCA